MVLVSLDIDLPLKMAQTAAKHVGLLYYVLFTQVSLSVRFPSSYRIVS
jgi:hypothetical protein